MLTEIHENFEDVIEDKVFKFKYRQNADPVEVYEARTKRMIDRFLERAKTRDPAIEQDLNELYASDDKSNTVAALMVDADNFRRAAHDDTLSYREYIAREGVQQYRDYYEDAPEEQSFFEYLDNLTNRDMIRFMECFKDYTIDERGFQGYATITKREFNPEISAFSNLLLDLVDFRDRVRPAANDIARMDAASMYQRHSPSELMEEFKEGIAEGDAAEKADHQSVEEGYSSLEIAAESGAEDTAAEEAAADTVSEHEAAEPDLDAAAEETVEEAAEETADEAAEETVEETGSDQDEPKKE